MIKLLLLISMANANSYTFKYKDHVESVTAPTYEQAYKIAAKQCFAKLNAIYTTEEHGLEVIDICANPK